MNHRLRDFSQYFFRFDRRLKRERELINREKKNEYDENLLIIATKQTRTNLNKRKILKNLVFEMKFEIFVIQ